MNLYDEQQKVRRSRKSTRMEEFNEVCGGGREGDKQIWVEWSGGEVKNDSELDVEITGRADTVWESEHI